MEERQINLSDEHEKQITAATTENRRDGLSDTQINGYKVGHFNNDLCASMWFIYLTYYLTYIVELPSNIVALALLSG